MRQDRGFGTGAGGAIADDEDLDVGGDLVDSRVGDLADDGPLGRLAGLEFASGSSHSSTSLRSNRRRPWWSMVSVTGPQTEIGRR